ncbi:translocase [Pseudooceanicola sp.]|uniref:preprotein translocase subunit SecA n=1 Tax=Pseudooceanicola sp. TaxID=1914328 RepID=UPI002601BB97|nr:translocase [Pseudooceanicola sp.]MDF1855736.1 translocase [Pseudooceanicola sp.]
MSDAARPWQTSERADTAEPERRALTPRRSDELVRTALSYLRRATRGPGLRARIETGAVIRIGRRLAALDDVALVAEVRAQAPLLLARGLRGRPMRIVAAGVREMTFRRLQMRHHPVQITGGLALTRGQIVEMATGEGKTITTLIPAVLVALTGVPVHVITVNKYLARRDAETLAPVLEAFGLTHGVITEETEHHLRPAIYGSDVVFTTNSDVTFDYLRDRLALGRDRTALAAIARRMLGGDGGRDSARILTRGLGFAVIDEVDSILIDEAQTPLIITVERPGGDAARAADEVMLALAATLDPGTHFQLDRKARSLRLLPPAADVLAGLVPPIPALIPEMARREALVQALSALHLYARDEDYIVTEDGLAIVDEFTGRVMPDRQWQSGLHQMIEAKERVERSGSRETLAQITYQTFFARYLWFAGMTGTAREVARELRLSHRRPVLRLPTHRRIRRRMARTRLYGRAENRWVAVARDAARIAGSGRPVLIGTRSVAASEAIAERLRAAGPSPVVLNARQDADEAGIVAEAGAPGRITVATNMAGRGTDIPVTDAVEAKGGLHVMLTEFHSSSRIDRQLIGRSARQGQRGSAAAYVSLEDPLFADMAPGMVRVLRALSARWPGRLPSPLAELLRNLAQARSERRGRKRRADTVRRARKQDKALGFRPDNI